MERRGLRFEIFCSYRVKNAAQKKIMANFDILANFFGIGATIRIGQEIPCLPYAGFFWPKHFHCRPLCLWLIVKTLILLSIVKWGQRTFEYDTFKKAVHDF